MSYRQHTSLALAVATADAGRLTAGDDGGLDGNYANGSMLVGRRIVDFGRRGKAAMLCEPAGELLGGWDAWESRIGLGMSWRKMVVQSAHACQASLLTE
jgi:hypothetical protein